jgi:hypothetical protein
VGGIASCHYIGQPVQFFGTDCASRFALYAAVDSDEQPFPDFLVSAIRKGRTNTNRPHKARYVMVARNAVHAQLQRLQKIAETCVGLFRVVVNQIARHEHAVGAPVGSRVVIQDPLQRVGRRDAAQLTVEVGEQVRVRQVQDPYRVIRCLNRRSPSIGSARACKGRR